MPLLAYGINHLSAPIALRERLTFNATELSDALQQLIRHPEINETVILSTCNRTEFYIQVSSYFPLQQWLATYKRVPHHDLHHHDYVYHEVDAIQHMMRVASGLDSMVLGESQVLGQMKQAYQQAVATNTVGPYFKQLFPAIFTTSKQIRTHTKIGAQPVSLAYAVVQLTKQRMKTLLNCSILLIGAGDIIELIATHLHDAGATQLTIANRHIENAHAIAHPLNAHTISIQDIPLYFHKMDVIITATTSQSHIIKKDLVENALSKRNHQPMLLIDLAVPRDIEPEIATLDHLSLYNIDDLHKTIQTNKDSRKAATAAAETIIQAQSTRFLRERRVYHAKQIITNYRKKLKQLEEAELQKSLKQLQKGVDPQVVLTQFSQKLIKKIMHVPTIKLREAASESPEDAIQLAKVFLE